MAAGLCVLPQESLIRPPSNRVQLAGADARIGVVYGTDRRDGLLSSVTRVDDTRTIWVVIWCQGGEHGIDGILALTLDDVSLPADAEVRHYYGTENQQPDSVLSVQVAGYDDALKYIDPITGKTIALAYSVIELDSAAGVPHFSATIRGLKIHDPRTDLIAWTDNAALCTADCIRSPVYGMGRPVSGLTGAADFCDELVEGERRNRIGLSVGFGSGETPRKRIDNLSMYAQCDVIPDGLARKLKPRIYRAPGRTITDADLSDSEPTFSVGGFDEVPNARRIVFRDTQSVPWRSHPGVAYPSESAQSISIQYDEEVTDLLGILHGGQAARMLARAVARDSGGSVSTSLNVLGAGFGLERGDNVYLELSGISGEFLITRIEYSESQGEYSIDLVPESPDFYPDDSAFIELLPVPYVPRSDSEEPPNIQGVFSGGGVYIEGADGTIHNRIRVDLSTPTDRLSFDHYEVRFRPLNSAEPWNEATVTGYTAYLEPVKEGVEYEFDLRAINKKGAGSSWVSGTHTVKAKDIPPPAVTAVAFAITALGNATIRATYNNEPSDWAGLRWEYRASGSYQPLTDGLTKNKIVESSALPTGSITFRVRSEDNTVSPVTGLRNASDWYYKTVSITESADGVWSEVDDRINTESYRNDGQDGDLNWQQNTKNPSLDTEDYQNNTNISAERVRNNSQDSDINVNESDINIEAGRNSGQDAEISVEQAETSNQKYSVNPALESADSQNSSDISVERTRNDETESDVVSLELKDYTLGLETANALSTANDAYDQARYGIVDGSRLGDYTVSGGKIINNSITETKISDNSISTGKLQANSITANELAANSVTAVQMTAGAVSAINISADQITSGEINGAMISGTLVNVSIRTDQVVNFFASVYVEHNGTRYNLGATLADYWST